MANSTHLPISPAILYWGTPVVLISTINPDGTYNIGPMSSAFWLGHHCMLGLENISQTTRNLQRTGRCTLNLASDDMADAINKLAITTGTDPVPESKVKRDYTFVKDKFGAAGLTQLPAISEGAAVGIKECPVVMEASLIATHEMFEGQAFKGGVLCFEVRIENVRVHPELKLEGHSNRIDSDKWKPMIMMFCELYGLKDGKREWSKLATIEEEKYRGFTGTTVKEKEKKEEEVGVGVTTDVS